VVDETVRCIPAPFGCWCRRRANDLAAVPSPPENSPSLTIQTTVQTDLLHLTAGGLIRLGPQFAPGDYAMQVIVTDKLAKKEKYRSAFQRMNFEVE
jgi:hypothetical protein